MKSELTVRLGEMESRFAEIVWRTAPINTTKLVDLCEEELNWARTTTYTVMKKLCNRGILHMEKREVTVLIGREEFLAIQTEHFAKKYFQGEMPAMLTSYLARHELTDEDVAYLQTLIDAHKA